MLFPTHLLVGYGLGRRWHLPSTAVVVGAALPDVIDKPIAMAGLTARYQTVGHSALVLVAVLGVTLVWSLGRRNPEGFPSRDEALLPALGLGWGSHLALDAAGMVLNGRPADMWFLGWPFVSHQPAVQLPPIDFVTYYLWTPSFFVELGLWGAAALLVATAVGVDQRS